MVIVLALAAAAIVIATSLTAKGFGGEMVRFPRDAPEFSFRPRSSADLLSLELPMSLFGFSEHATAGALNAVGRLLAAREAEIEYLKSELGRLSARPGQNAGTGGTADHREADHQEPATRAEPGS